MNQGGSRALDGVSTRASHRGYGYRSGDVSQHHQDQYGRYQRGFEPVVSQD